MSRRQAALEVQRLLNECIPLDNHSLLLSRVPGLDLPRQVFGGCAFPLRAARSLGGCVWAVYYKQIRKSEQRPPLHLRATHGCGQSRGAAGSGKRANAFAGAGMYVDV